MITTDEDGDEITDTGDCSRKRCWSSRCRTKPLRRWLRLMASPRGRTSSSRLLSGPEYDRALDGRCWAAM